MSWRYARASLLILFALSAVPVAGRAAEQPIDEFGEALSGYRDNRPTGEARFVSASASLRLTPVPDERSLVLDLNGTWSVQDGASRTFQDADAQEFASWKKIAVPSDAATQGVNLIPGYIRSFAVPAAWEGKRVKLRCDEIATHSTVWINGNEVGQHVGQFIGFELDITDAVHFGSENTLAVRVSKHSLARRVSGYSNHVGGGITRKIYAFAVPNVHLAMFHVATDFDEDFVDAACKFDVQITNEGTVVAEKPRLIFRLVGPDGNELACDPPSVSLPDVPAGKTIAQRVSVAVKKPLHWESEHPNLYTLTATLRQDDISLYTTTRRIGFREIEVRGNQLLVNGTPVKLRGVNRHQAHPTRGRATTPELDRRDAEMFKAANCNFVRTSHYPPSEEFIEACNELGLFVEEEAPMSFFHPEKDKGLKPDDYAQYVVYANLKMVQRDRSHPSVLFWSIANESSWGPHFRAAAEAVAKVDPTRPRTFMWFPGGDRDSFLNIAAEHYPGMSGVSQARSLPTIFSEFCHLPAYVPNEMLTDPSVDDRWGEMLTPIWNRLYGNKGGLGAAIWCGTDDSMYVPRDEGKPRRFGVADWGVIDGWRRPKPEYWHMKKTYTPVKVLTRRVPQSSIGAFAEIAVENRYNFSNLDELKIAWKVGSESGTVTADIPPRRRGRLSIPVPAEVPAGDALELQFIHSDGRVVDRYVLPFEDTRLDARPAQEQTPWELSQQGGEIQLMRGCQRWSISATTGKVDRVTVDGKPVLIGGPHLSYVKTFSKVQQWLMRQRPVEPVIGAIKDWQAGSVAARQTGDSVELAWSGVTPLGKLRGKYVFEPNGEVQIAYTFTPDFTRLWEPNDLVRAEHNNNRAHVFVKLDRDAGTVTLQSVRGRGPHYDVPIERTAAVPRQLGLEFELPVELDTLRWDRRAQWTIYPDDHIGRPRGCVRAFPLGRKSLIRDHRTRPQWPWAHDAVELGCRDFRSTKSYINRISLDDNRESSLQVISNGKQHARAYMHQGRVHLLIDGFGNGPSEGFMSHYFGKGSARMLAYGESFSDTVRLRLISDGTENSTINKDTT